MRRVLARDAGCCCCWELVLGAAAELELELELEVELLRMPVFGSNWSCWVRAACVIVVAVGSLLAVMNGLLGPVTRRRAIRCVVAIVPAGRWACQPSIRGGGSSNSVMGF